MQVIYNIFEQAPEDKLFPACQKHQVGVIVRVALDEGGLTGQITPQTRFEDGDFGGRYFRGGTAILERETGIELSRATLESCIC